MKIRKFFTELFKKNIFPLFRRVGVDRLVLLGILAKIWSIFAGLVTLLVIAYKFSPQLQGYYYTFLSIIAFQVLIELGLSNIIVQFASHEWSKLSLDKKGAVIGPAGSLCRLQSLAQMFFRWYCVSSVILTLALGVCGFFIFSKNQESGISWMLPWFSLCICNGAIFCLLPIWSLLEGCNQILKLYSYKFIQSIILSVSFWGAVFLKAGLWAVVISYAVILACAAVFLLSKCRIFLKTLLFSSFTGRGVDWFKEVLPLQARTTITWLIGSFTFSMFVPVLFRYHGAVIAGQMGMTLTLINAVYTLPSAWLNPKVPQFGMLIAQKKYTEIDNIFWRTTKIIIVIAIAGAVTAWVLVYALNRIGHPFAKRFLPLLPTGIFILAHTITSLTAPFSAYLHAHKKEPLLVSSVIAGISVGASTLILGKRYAAVGVAGGYLLITLFLVPVIFIIWRRCKTKWHKDEHPDPVILGNFLTNNEVV